MQHLELANTKIFFFFFTQYRTPLIGNLFWHSHLRNAYAEEYTYSKRFDIYLKFSFNWLSYLLNLVTLSITSLTYTTDCNIMF